MSTGTKFFWGLAMKAAGLLALTALWLLLPGCALRQDVRLVRDQLAEAQQENIDLRAQVEQLERRIARQSDQIAVLQDLGAARLEHLFFVNRIELGRHTGGYRQQSEAYDSGVRVYLQPIDQHGSVIKAAGEATVELFDLSQGQEAFITSCQFPVEQISDHWASGFVTYHYRFDCPWPEQLPTGSEIAVRVRFVDYLTGRPFTAQRIVRVTLPPPAETLQH